MQIFFVLYFVIFFDFFRFLKINFSRIWMKPPSSILIFQHGLDFPGPEAIQNFFFEFFRNLRNRHFFDTNSTFPKSV